MLKIIKLYIFNDKTKGDKTIQIQNVLFTNYFKKKYRRRNREMNIINKKKTPYFFIVFCFVLFYFICKPFNYLFYQIENDAN